MPQSHRRSSRNGIDCKRRPQFRRRQQMADIDQFHGQGIWDTDGGVSLRCLLAGNRELLGSHATVHALPTLLGVSDRSSSFATPEASILVMSRTHVEIIALQLMLVPFTCSASTTRSCWTIHVMLLSAVRRRWKTARIDYREAVRLKSPAFQVRVEQPETVVLAAQE